MEEKERFVTIGEAADMLNRHPNTLRAWDLMGILPPTKRVRGTRYYSVKMLNDFMNDDRYKNEKRGKSGSNSIPRDE